MFDDDDDLELFDEAKSAFPGMEDLDGRLVAIWTTGVSGERKGTSGKPYTWIETVTVVLDDGVDGGKTTELVGSAPYRLEAFQHSTTGLVARLRTRLDNHRPMLGRINSQPSSMNKRVLAYSIAEPTDADKATAVQHADLIRSITAEMKAKREKNSEPAFD